MDFKLRDLHRETGRAGQITRERIEHRHLKLPYESRPLRPRLLYKNRLAADSKALNQSLVALRTAIFQIVEQLATTGHHSQQPAPGVMVFTMRFKMLSQLENALTQEGDLYLWRPRIRSMDSVLVNYL